jgi:hypothetical protein
MITEDLIVRNGFEAVEAFAECAYLGRGRFDGSKVQKDAHDALDYRLGKARVELCVERCKG